MYQFKSLAFEADLFFIRFVDVSRARHLSCTLGKDWCNTSDYQLAKPKLSCCRYPNISWL